MDRQIASNQINGGVLYFHDKGPYEGIILKGEDAFKLDRDKAIEICNYLMNYYNIAVHEKKVIELL